MVSHFLIDLHEANMRMTNEASFLSMGVMSTLETPQTMVFRTPSHSDSSDDFTEDLDESTAGSYEV